MHRHGKENQYAGAATISWCSLGTRRTCRLCRRSPDWQLRGVRRKARRVSVRSHSCRIRGRPDASLHKCESARDALGGLGYPIVRVSIGPVAQGDLLLGESGR